MVCQDEYAVRNCATCDAPICPAHRWSTGRESDGYYCVDSYCAPMHQMVLSMPPGPFRLDDSETPAEPPLDGLDLPPAGNALTRLPLVYRLAGVTAVTIFLADWRGLKAVLGFLVLLTLWEVAGYVIRRPSGRSHPNP